MADELKLKMLSDSLLSEQSQISILKSDVDKNKSNLKQWIFTDVILFILVLVIIILYYSFTSKKIDNGSKKIEVRLSDIKESFDAELLKTRNDLENLKGK